MQKNFKGLITLIIAILTTWYFMIRVWGVWQIAILFAIPFIIFEIGCYIFATIERRKECSKK